MGINYQGCRRFCRPPKKMDSVAKCGGQYAYFGIKLCTLKILAHKPSSFRQDRIDLYMNIDGVPLFKSYVGRFWPILCRFGTFQLFGALYYGNEKTNVAEEYLLDFIEETLSRK